MVRAQLALVPRLFASLESSEVNPESLIYESRLNLNTLSSYVPIHIVTPDGRYIAIVFQSPTSVSTPPRNPATSLTQRRRALATNNYRRRCGKNDDECPAVWPEYKIGMGLCNIIERYGSRESYLRASYYSEDGY